MERGFKIPRHVLNDLSCRFLLNIPETYQGNMIRLFFQAELAHWYYLDFLVDDQLRPVGMKEFLNQLFQHVPFLVDKCKDGQGGGGVVKIEDFHEQWKRYKLGVPTYGVIMLDPSMEHCLLVQGYSKSWGFPKGKVNEAEEAMACAARECKEETGYDATGKLIHNAYIEHTISEQKCRLYILPDVPLDTNLRTETRQEIRAMKWFPIRNLPTNRKENVNIDNMSANSFFMVMGFVNKLKKWINKQKQRPDSRGLPQSPIIIRKNKAQADFQQQMQNEYQELLNIAEGKESVRRKKPPIDRVLPGTPKSPISDHINTATTQQYTLMPRLEWQTMNPQPVQIKPVNEWLNFKLDTNSIINAAFSHLR